MELADEEKHAGYYSISWNAEGLASGIYFIRINALPQSSGVSYKTPIYSKTRKVLLLK